ncbi:5-oxoprolinase subunit C family protein [Rathayibacter soli]|uniref:5-oxoprolinase subunit C family protein n=1 Tax=Rathayibacter soli TaxID=3144168 RepID=UPI0027E4D960|nr:biotin-dependent carboxyltransferase family protein [Glaciibacter superstes]
MTLVEDLGRPGYAAIGAARSGALDRGALRLGNRLVGNSEGAAALEVTAGGFAAVLDRGLWFAITGAGGPLTLDGVPVEADVAVRASAGSVLRIGVAMRGMRFYLAVRGGVAVAAELGSRSRDILTGLGPAPLRAGDVVPIGADPATPIPVVDTMTVSQPSDDTVLIGLHPGPRADWFTAESLERFYDTEWMVAGDSNRVGLRLDAASGGAGASGGGAGGARLLERAVTRELPSEPMVPGAIQVPPSGQPTVLLADHPVTGGYPVIAVVADASLDTFAQLRPGQRVEFRHAR